MIRSTLGVGATPTRRRVENWTVFDPIARAILDACPELSKDRDLCNSNPGICLVVLQ
jgi:hypothetical protein